MDAATAFRLLPTAHHYDIKSVLQWCCEAVKRSPLKLHPLAPIASSDVPNHPGLIQWLALADGKQCRPMVETCLDKIFPASEVNDTAASRSVMRKTLISPHLRALVSFTDDLFLCCHLDGLTGTRYAR